ncbi:Uu.00g023440.m01.CDS01 [Anthostomella pinea]|uniref:Uu.00g023440.m01.CDS01 n=1 Tax=Anthostomella pinea TaxID=933095 RepID=A0AAI8YR25_9PEZI|nr:Uu.00g023440.m01.CDS01 [Anthostomella pinea]
MSPDPDIKHDEKGHRPESDEERGVSENEIEVPNAGIVGWESQDDPAMPLNFTSARKWVIVSSLTLITFMSLLSSSMLAPAIADINAEFHNVNITKGAFPVHGRAPVLTAANIFLCLWHIGCALAPSLDVLVAFHFLSGVDGSGCLTLRGAVIGDLFPVVERGKALSLWTLGPLIGPTLGPLLGAFFTASFGWRWAPWIVFIPSVIVTLVLAIFLPETNHKVLVGHKVKRVSKELDRNDLVSCYEKFDSAQLSQTAILKTGFSRPLKMLAFAPILSVLSIYKSFIYGTMYLMYNSISPTFEDHYGFSTGITGVVYLSMGLGYMVGLYSFSVLFDKTAIRLTKANNGVYEPEIAPQPNRLLRLHMADHLLLVHWIVPIIALFPLGLGIIGVFLPTQAYIIDAYPTYLASGLAAFTVLRSVTAAFLPLAGPSLFSSLGLGWGNSVLGFIAIAFIPVPILVYRFGTGLRKRYPLEL